MTHSLYAKFILGYLVFGLIGFVFIATFSSHITYRYLISEESEALYDEANLLAGTYSDIYQGRNISLDTASPQLEETAPSSHVGTVIKNFDPTAAGNQVYMIGDFFGAFDSDTLSVLAPITGNFNTYGYVVIHMPMSQVLSDHTEILNIIYLTAGIIFFLSLIILLVFTKTVYLPLKKITAGAMEYADGNLGHTIKVKTSDEIGYLANTLNYMSSELNKMEKYLNIVISETERLNKLTQGMLTLNSLDSKGFLSRSNFDINRVIKDTAASFEGTCNAKDIVLDLTFSNDVQMVYADLGKIQQVLYNLIDNAIKFSHENSVIYIQTAMRYEKVFVSVKDTGVGIPKENIKKIWDRFYKSDTSRGKDKKGTGLGLAIVKEIIQAHGENIDVVSTAGVGTEFIFTLPKAANL